VSEAKPYDIPKQLVWKAYQRVKANRGAAGVDGVSLAVFEKDLKRNLYKVWNRMSSGSYHPPPVRLVEIEKDNGGTRPLGIPTIADRVAQTVAKMVLDPIVEPVFHADSYGYRPGRSALDAVGVARKRCWGFDWVIDLDIKAFFDSIPHDLVERAVAHHTDLAWFVCTSAGGFVPRSSIRTGLSWHGRRARTKGTDEGHAPGRCHKSAARQSVPALCVRHLDGADIPRQPVRAICGRCHRPLPAQGGGGDGAGGHPGSLCGVRLGASSDEDQDRLLQGC